MSNKIKKDQAKEVAKQILLPKVKELKAGLLTLKEKVEKEWSSKIPDGIKEAFAKEDQRYFHVTGYRTGVIFVDDYQESHFRLEPAKAGDYTRRSIDFSKEIIAFNNELVELSERIKKAELELTEHIYKLGTPAKIFEVFEIEVTLPERQVSLINPETLTWVLKK